MTQRESSKSHPIGEMRTRPNIVLLLSDQHTLSMLGRHGNRDIHTPNLDALAEQGVTFMNSYCTSPLCAPARSSIHTGRMPHVTRVNHNRSGGAMDWTLPNIGDAVRSAGYRTAWSGKLHLGGLKPGDTETPTPPGMDAPARLAHAYYPTSPDGIPGFENLNYAGAMKAYASQASGQNSHRLGLDVDEPAVEEAIHFIERSHEAPFFLVVSILNPHDICFWPRHLGGFHLPPRRMTPSNLPPLPPNHEAPEGEVQSLVDARENRGPRLIPSFSERQWREYIHAYSSLVEHCDRSVGRVLSALRDARRDEDTLVIYTSDHGEAAGAHKLRGKKVPYEEAVAVPFIMKWKGEIPAGVIDRSHLISAVDIFPTVCDYAGAKIPESVEGTSIRGVVEDPSKPGRATVPIEVGKNPAPNGKNPKVDCRIIRTQRFKFIRFDTGEEMLFDIVGDRGEMKNLAGAPEYATTLREHRDLLSRYVVDTRDHFEMTGGPASLPGS